MKRTVCVAIVILSAISTLAFAEKIAALPELARPAILIVENDRVFVLQDTTVLIYSLKDFKLIHKFGKAGEGPGEFVYNANNGRPMSMSLYKKNILVNSFGRISYFDKFGKFIKERKVTADALLIPIQDKFVGIGPINDGPGRQPLGFRLFEQDLKKWKVLYLSDLDVGNRIREFLLPIVTFTYNPVYKDKIYINTSTSEFIIDVFDSSGKKLYTIKKDYKNIPTPSDYKQTCLEWFKNSPRFKRAYEMIKQMVKVRDHFPAIRDMQIVDDIIHVITYKRKGDQWECILLDLKGKELGRTFILLDKYIPFTFYPILYSSYKGNMYTLVENIDEEEWELHRTPLK